MCGFVGLVAAHASVEQRRSYLTRMTTTLIHRGPDDAGLWIDPASGVGFGFRRLAIVDLSAHGHQPMQSASGRYSIVFNGEIYNFPELRTELEQLGHRFRGSSDTEILLSAVEQWGLTAAMPRLIGMFAFALWDRQQRTLALVRDRLGIKPLYYGWCGETFVYGSELKALYAHPDHTMDVDRAALALFLRYGYVPAPLTICEGMAKLPPGSILTFDPARPDDPTMVAYWSAKQAAQRGQALPFQGTFPEAVSQFDALLRRVVADHMLADVPLGAFLSGGIDSSLIVAMMQAQHHEPVKTFSIGFYESGYDESQHARRVADYLGTNHTELHVTPTEAQQLIPTLPAIYDEPFADPSQLPTLLVSQLARRDVTVSLSGDGGDELFGGYTRYQRARWLWRARTMVPPPLRQMVGRSICRLVPARKRLHAVGNLLTRPDRAQFYQRFIAHWEDANAVVHGSHTHRTEHTDPAVWADVRTLEAQMMYIDLRTYLPDDILVKLDRASMATSLEARVPLLDHRVVEFAWQMPLAHKMSGRTGKRLLRELLHQHVPRELVERPKQGFSVPLQTWLRGPLRPWADTLLAPEGIRREGFFEADTIQQRWEQHCSGDYDWQQLLWNVLMFQCWWEHWQHPRPIVPEQSIQTVVVP